MMDGRRRRRACGPSWTRRVAAGTRRRSCGRRPGWRGTSRRASATSTRRWSWACARWTSARTGSCARRWPAGWRAWASRGRRRPSCGGSPPRTARRAARRWCAPGCCWRALATRAGRPRPSTRPRGWMRRTPWRWSSRRRSAAGPRRWWGPGRPRARTWTPRRAGERRARCRRSWRTCCAPSRRSPPASWRPAAWRWASSSAASLTWRRRCGGRTRRSWRVPRSGWCSCGGCTRRCAPTTCWARSARRSTRTWTACSRATTPRPSTTYSCASVCSSRWRRALRWRRSGWRRRTGRAPSSSSPSSSRDHSPARTGRRCSTCASWRSTRSARRPWRRCARGRLPATASRWWRGWCGARPRDRRTARVARGARGCWRSSPTRSSGRRSSPRGHSGCWRRLSRRTRRPMPRRSGWPYAWATPPSEPPSGAPWRRSSARRRGGSAWAGGCSRWSCRRRTRRRRAPRSPRRPAPAGTWRRRRRSPRLCWTSPRRRRATSASRGSARRTPATRARGRARWRRSRPRPRRRSPRCSSPSPPTATPPPATRPRRVARRSTRVRRIRGRCGRWSRSPARARASGTARRRRRWSAGSPCPSREARSARRSRRRWSSSARRTTRSPGRSAWWRCGRATWGRRARSCAAWPRRRTPRG